jgi:hypothetical protein
VPLTGDLAGPKTIRAVGKYLNERDAVVSAFYVSNVEQYLFQGGDRIGNPNGGAAAFYENVATLPLDRSSTLIRWLPFDRDSGTSIALAPIQTTIADFREGRLVSPGFLGGFRQGPRGGREAQRGVGIVVTVAVLLLNFFAWYLVRGRTRR